MHHKSTRRLLAPTAAAALIAAVIAIQSPSSAKAAVPDTIPLKVTNNSGRGDAVYVYTIGTLLSTGQQGWADATSLLSTVRALLNTTDESVSAARDRLQRLNAVQKDPQQEIDRTRFAIRDAQRLAMTGRSTPEPRHARPLDDSVARLDRAIAGLEGRHPDYWHFLTETDAVRQTVARVVSQIREERGGGH